ncbi:acyltransferase [Streptosporangium oxazolinicum]|uniref:Acyltransferase n=1 Tax=Streptosporangium oxazolinicum TaxID=909287 RepID=A0ABP8BGV1_9ACTN
MTEAGSPPAYRPVTPSDVRDLPAVDGRLDALDGVRAVASFCVLFYHVAAQTGVSLREGFVGGLIARGDIGVPIFFLLSGLLLYRPWARQVIEGTSAPGTTGYLWRRALRILPAYWLVVVVAMVLWAPGAAGDPLKWLPLLLLGQNYVTTPWWEGASPVGLGQMWSLSVEMSFYIALPVIAVLLRAVAGRGASPSARAVRLLFCLGALASTSFAWTIFTHVPDHRPELGLWLPRLLVYFCAGMALAVVSLWARAEPDPEAPVRRLTRGIRESWFTCWVIAAFVLAIAATPIAGGRLFELQDLWTDVFEIVLYTAFVLAFLSPVALLTSGPSPLRSLLGNRVMRYLGRISYGVFLWQFVVIVAWYELTGQAAFTGDLVTTLVVCTALTVAIADLTHRLVEGPAQRLYRLLPQGRNRDRDQSQDRDQGQGQGQGQDRERDQERDRARQV